MNNIQERILNLINKKDISQLSLRAIGQEVGVDHPNTVKYHLEQLKHKGLIYYDGNTKKIGTAQGESFMINELFNLPIMGLANCGEALEFAQDTIEGYLKLSPKIVDRKNPQGLFIVKAVGKSLNRANIKGKSIKDGDYVVIDTNLQPRDGEYVLSIIDGLANIKRYYKDDQNKEIRLISESSLNIPPIILHEEDLATSAYSIKGVVIKVIKGQASSRKSSKGKNKKST